MSRVQSRPIPRLALRPQEAADALGVSLGQFRLWVASGKMPKPTKVGKGVALYDVDELRRAWDALREAPLPVPLREEPQTEQADNWG